MPERAAEVVENGAQAVDFIYKKDVYTEMAIVHRNVIMKIENPVVIATQDFVLYRPDGTTAKVQAMVGTPYQTGSDWACPCALYGFEGRYSDIMGISALQALAQALALLRARVEIMREAGEVGMAPEGRHIPQELMDALFGRS